MSAPVRLPFAVLALAHPGRAGDGLLRALVEWQARHRDRRALAALDPHLLDDIGLTARDARDEAAKPFWRD